MITNQGGNIKKYYFLSFFCWKKLVPLWAYMLFKRIRVQIIDQINIQTNQRFKFKKKTIPVWNFNSWLFIKIFIEKVRSENAGLFVMWNIVIIVDGSEPLDAAWIIRGGILVILVPYLEATFGRNWAANIYITICCCYFIKLCQFWAMLPISFTSHFMVQLT